MKSYLAIGVMAAASMVVSCARKHDGGKAITHAYALATSNPDQVVLFVQKNAPLFHSKGPGIEAGRRLASALVNAALSAPSASSIYEHSMDIASRAGAPELGRKVADSMSSSRGDMLWLARDIQELVETLPEIADGDDGPYRETNLYQRVSAGWSTIGQYGGFSKQELNVFRRLVREINEWYVATLFKAMP